MSIAPILNLAREKAGDDPWDQIEFLAQLVSDLSKHVSTGLLRAGKAEQPNTDKGSE
jgi:hypothetical protein